MTPHSSSVQRDLFDPRRDQQDVRELTLMVVLTQLAGLLLIFFGLWLLKTMPDDLWSFVNRVLKIGGVVTAIWWIYCWYDAIGNVLYGWYDSARHFFPSDEDISNPPAFVPRITPISAPLRKTRVFRAILALVVADNLMLGLVIVMSGGPGSSSLDPLLPMIVIIAIILKQPTRTVAVALWLEFTIILCLGLHWLLHAHGYYHPHLGDGWIYDSHSDPNYPLAFAIVAAGSVLLSVCEYLIVHARPHLSRNIGTSVAQLNVSIPDLKRSTRALRQGTESWIKWLTHRGIPPFELSLVHDEGNVIKQALILSIPYWTGETSLSLRKRKEITRHIAFLTFAAHWIDDHCDALERYCPNKRLQLEVVLSRPQEIINSLQPRLGELVKRMQTLADKKHQAQIERAVVRIVYGGLIQNSPSPERREHLLKDYKEHISNGLCDTLKEKYAEIFSKQPLSIWVTSKVVIELLDCCSPTFNIDVAEFHNLLYGPILYYQNSQQEVRVERFGAAFGATHTDIEKQLPTVDDMVSLVDTCKELAPKILGTKTLPPARKTQLRTLLSLYGDSLPSNLLRSYDSFLKQ